MQTRVADVTGQKDFYLAQSNSDYVNLSNWATTTIYTPTGAVSEVLAGNPNAFLYSRNATAGTPPLATAIVTDVTGTGDLGILYTSIQEGNGVLNTGSSIPGSITPAGSEWQYNGSQGTTIPDSASYNLGATGTVSAWVYINAQTDTGGIVHKGVQAEFLRRELFSSILGQPGPDRFRAGWSCGRCELRPAHQQDQLEHREVVLSRRNLGHDGRTEVHQSLHQRDPEQQHGACAGRGRCLRERFSGNYRLPASDDVQLDLRLLRLQRQDQRRCHLGHAHVGDRPWRPTTPRTSRRR